MVIAPLTKPVYKCDRHSISYFGDWCPECGKDDYNRLWLEASKEIVATVQNAGCYRPPSVYYKGQHVGRFLAGCPDDEKELRKARVRECIAQWVGQWIKEQD